MIKCSNTECKLIKKYNVSCGKLAANRDLTNKSPRITKKFKPRLEDGNYYCSEFIG